MADIPTVIRNHQLKAFELDIVHFTGEELGEGSYGSVEIVEVAGERCAAKILHEALVEANSRLPNQRARGCGYQPRSLIEAFTTECSLMSEVRHPNIVRFLGICYRRPRESIPVIVMELLKTCLHEFLESETTKNQVIPLSIKLCILLDVSKGLVHLHSLDIVHRDLTARNVLLSQSLTAKIADLGMARLIELKPGRQEATMTKGPGNANYMPPEARDGGPMSAQYGKAIDCFSMGHLILFTATQEFPEPLYPTYFDSQSRTTKLKVRTEIERRENSFQAAITEVGQDHPLLQVASQCLQNNPQIRPTASEMMMQIQEEAVGELRQENVKLKSDLNEHQCQSQRVIDEHLHQSQQVIDELTRDNEDLQSKHLEAVKEKEALLKKMEEQDHDQEVHKSIPEAARVISIETTASNRVIPDRQIIVKDIQAIKVESGKPLRQVQVSKETYFKAKKFVLTSPNTLDNGSFHRFKILYRLPSGRYIYDLLIADAGSTTLQEADKKITEWQDASKSLVRYALNLLLAPKRPEFQRFKLSSSYYVYQVAKQLKGAEELLQAMGFEKIGGSREAQELKYTGDVDSNKIAETAADLVILDGELDRIKSLVVYAQDEHISINLSIILQVRSHPTSIFTDAKFTLNRYHPQGHLPVQRPAAQGQSPPPRAQDSQQQQYATPPPQQLTPLQWQKLRSMQPHGQPSYPDARRSSAPNPQWDTNFDQREEAYQVRIDNHPKNLPLSEDKDLYANVPMKKNKKYGINDYVNYTPRTLFSPPDPNDFPVPSEQPPSCPPDSLSPQPPSRPPDSLSPRKRSRLAAMSKGSPTTSGSSIVATPHSATATALSPQSPDVAVSKKHLGALSNAVGRERSTTHTHLDKGLQSPFQSPLPINVDGAWTCNYCTNLVFGGNICDVCSHERTTLV